MHFSGGYDKIVWNLLLEHHPHALDIILGMAPITLRVQITQLNIVLLAKADLGNRSGRRRREKKVGLTI